MDGDPEGAWGDEAGIGGEIDGRIDDACLFAYFVEEECEFSGSVREGGEKETVEEETRLEKSPRRHNEVQRDEMMWGGGKAKINMQIGHIGFGLKEAEGCFISCSLAAGRSLAAGTARYKIPPPTPSALTPNPASSRHDGT